MFKNINCSLSAQQVDKAAGITLADCKFNRQHHLRQQAGSSRSALT